MTAVMIRDLLAFGLGLTVAFPVAYCVAYLHFRRHSRRYYI